MRKRTRLSSGLFYESDFQVEGNVPSRRREKAARDTGGSLEEPGIPRVRRRAHAKKEDVANCLQ